MEVKPFKAFRFDAGVVGDVGSCIAPPYDVISPAQQEQLYQKSKYNIVRIIKGKTTSSDNDSDNQYTRAVDCLNSWIEEGALKQDSAETVYAYIQDFELAGTKFQRLSFVALAKLEEFGKTVRPHEEILDEPMLDRLNLKKVTSADLGLVFILYEDKEKIADKIIKDAATQEPLIDFVDEPGVRHRLFAITARDSIDSVTKMMSDKSCIIADGHHRYTTGLIYSKQDVNPTARYQMLGFTNTCQDGLVVLAAHRLVGNLENLHSKQFIACLEESFEITRSSFGSLEVKTQAKQKMLAQIRAECDRDENAFGIYDGTNSFYVAVLKDKRAMDSVAPNMSAAWKSLDVSVLHKLVLEKLLGLGAEQLAGGTSLEYVKDTENAIDESIEKVDRRQKQIAFFMNPPKIRQIQMVADQGEKMPQKSTYFYPKMYTGLTINKL